MQATELSCPHCGSTLNFGIEILAGTSVECMICMQSFTAAPKAVSAPAKTPAPAAAAPKALPAPKRAAPSATIAPASIAAAKAAPKAPPPSSASFSAPPVAAIAAGEPALGSSVPKSTPYSAPPAAAIAAGEPPQAPPPVSSPEKTASNASRPSPRPKAAFDPSKLILAAIAAGLFFILTTGIAFALWKITMAVRTPTNDQQLAGPGTKDAKNKNGGAKDADGEDTPADPTGEDPEWRKEKEKILLARKEKLFNQGADLQFDPINLVKIPKQAIPGLDQQKINTAIENGIIYLKKSQLANGTWANGHPVGHAAIGGLTLLECGVPANDFFVQRAALHVRNGIAKHQGTYEISLAILFLDRLGDPRDRLAIQALALRLLAGQNDSGGWSYTCPDLPPDQMYQLFAFLNSHKQPNLQNPLGGNPALQNPIQRDGLNPDDPFVRLHEMMLGHGTTNPTKDGVIQPINPKLPPVKAVPKGQPIAPNWLRAELQNLPIVQNQGKAKGKGRIGGGGGDNSNTQFAMLGLWAARRHGVPTDQALLASYQRFETTQSPDGGWGYSGVSKAPAMTGVGLLGEALGHGAAPEILAVNPKNPKQVLFKPVLEDPTIQKGLICFSTYIGQPSMDPKKTTFPMENLYFLWTVERVAMLYDLKTINGKDWYGWGAQILVHNQTPEGSWVNSHYHGQNPPLNTCFALLFLRRSNLVQDLTNNLRLHSAIPDAGK